MRYAGCGKGVLVALVVVSTGVTVDAETLKVATGQRGNWDSAVGEIGQRAGIFKKYGLDLEILYTQGSGETQQAVVSGSTQIGVAAGVLGVLSAYSKGAPVRVIGAEMTGAGDLYWYVRNDSPIQSLKDTNNKTIAYSTKGSSTDGIVEAFIREYHLTAKPTATGSPPNTLTQVMSGQIDVGWSAPPLGLDKIDNKEIRVIATGNDASVFKGQTVRFTIANAQALKDQKDAIERYMKAYRETIDFMYKDPKALDIYADFANTTVAFAQRTRDGFFPLESLNPDKVIGLAGVMPNAVDMKFLSAPLTDAQLADMIQIPPR